MGTFKAVMGKLPKLLGLATVAILLKASCEEREKPQAPTVTKETRAKTSRQVHETMAPGDTTGEDTRVRLEEEAELAYRERCLHKQNKNTFDFTEQCQEIQARAALKLNTNLGDFHQNGRLKELEYLESCFDHHWVDDKNRTTYDMLAGPGDHSHFEFGNWDCVTGLSVYTNSNGHINCKLSTVCKDDEERRYYINGYVDSTCDTKPFSAVQALDQLDAALDENLEAAAAK